MEHEYMIQHTFPEAVKLLFCFNIYSQLRSDYAANRVLYPMDKQDMPDWLQLQMTRHDPTAVKGFVELRIVEILDVRIEFVKSGTNVGVYYENEPALDVHTVRPVFKCRVHPEQAEAMSDLNEIWLDAS